MKITTAASTLNDTGLALQECIADLNSSSSEPDWLLVFCTDGHDLFTAAGQLASSFQSIPIHGGTSCMGVMSTQGFHSRENCGMGMLAISDPDGDYGVGVADIGDNALQAATAALESALADADRADEIPELVWMNAAPGYEEELIKGIEAAVGPDVPIAGGSTADNTVSGNWRQLAGSEVYENAVVISVFFPSVKLSYAFHSGYDPTELRGRVSKAQGRTLMEIDGRPAAEVYNKWTGGLIDDALPDGGNVLGATTLAPLGRQAGMVGEIPYFKLSHPDMVTADGALTLFADITEGEEIVLMKGSKGSLVTRAGRVTQAAIAAGGIGTDAIAGAMVIYCAGCMLTVQDDMAAVANEIGAALNQAPFLGVFTFGEQGCFVSHENSHGNLMISVVVFSTESDF